MVDLENRVLSLKDQSICISYRVNFMQRLSPRELAVPVIEKYSRADDPKFRIQGLTASEICVLIVESDEFHS